MPAALAVRDTPLHPAPRRTAFVLIGLAAIALVGPWWAAWTSSPWPKASSSSASAARSMQPLERCVVHRVPVARRRACHGGPDAGRARSDGARRGPREPGRAAPGGPGRRLARGAAAGVAPGAPAGATDAAGRLDAVARQRETLAMLRAEWGDLQARLERLDAEADRRRAERDTALAAATRPASALPLAARREGDLRALAGEGFASTHAWEDRRRERLDLSGGARTPGARGPARPTPRWPRPRATRAALIAETASAARPARRRPPRGWRRSRRSAARRGRRDELTRLIAPVDGTVQQLAIHTPGGIVTEAQALMVIVPDDAPVTAEVMLQNKDIGFVRVGDAAAIKLEAFPFTRHGTLPATVTRVSPDAIDHEQLGPRFAVTLTLDARDIEVDGARVPLRPGMALAPRCAPGAGASSDSC